MKKQNLATLVGVGVVLYHLAALVKDGEQWLANARKARDNPSLDTLTGLFLASGIIIIDLGRI